MRFITKLLIRGHSGVRCQFYFHQAGQRIRHIRTHEAQTPLFSFILKNLLHICMWDFLQRGYSHLKSRGQGLELGLFDLKRLSCSRGTETKERKKKKNLGQKPRSCRRDGDDDGELCKRSPGNAQRKPSRLEAPRSFQSQHLGGLLLARNLNQRPYHVSRSSVLFPFQGFRRRSQPFVVFFRVSPFWRQGYEKYYQHITRN